MTTEGGASGAVDAAESAANSTPMSWLARIGLTARGVVYLVMGWLAVLVATGSQAEVDQKGALTQVLGAPFGAALVWLLPADKLHHRAGFMRRADLREADFLRNPLGSLFMFGVAIAVHKYNRNAAQTN